MELTKEDELLMRLKEIKAPFNSHAVREIGLKMFYDRADRTVRDWASDGKVLRRIPLEECIQRGLVKRGRAPLAHWEFIT